MRADEVRPLLNRFTPLPTFFAISASDATKPRRRYRNRGGPGAATWPGPTCGRTSRAFWRCPLGPRERKPRGRILGSLSAWYFAAAFRPAGAGPWPRPAAARRPSSGVRCLPPGPAAARRRLGITMAPMAGLPLARGRGRRAARSDRSLAARRDGAGGDRLHRWSRAHRNGPGLPGHPRWRAQRHSGRVRPRALRPACCRDARSATLRGPVGRGLDPPPDGPARQAALVVLAVPEVFGCHDRPGAMPGRSIGV